MSSNDEAMFAIAVIPGCAVFGADPESRRLVIACGFRVRSQELAPRNDDQPSPKIISAQAPADWMTPVYPPNPA
jgi:hypothetical protein